MRRMVAGEFTRRAGACYESHMRVTSSTNYRSLLIDALDDLGLTLTPQTATDVLQCINDEGTAPDDARGGVAAEHVSLTMEVDDVERRLTPAEFCVVAAELHYQHHPPPSLPSSSLPSISVPATRTTSDNLQRDSQSPCEVFLGGSCNPTVWRKQVAIPMLEQEKITYHNPQVEEWKPELIELEERAKEEARMLFYVVDDKTRAVSSMVELGYYTGLGRQIVATVNNITGSRPQVAGEDLYIREIEDLNRGRALVRDILDCHTAVLENSIEDGIGTVAKILRDPSYSLCSNKNHNLVQVTNVIRVLQQVFTMHDMERKGSLNDTEAVLALKSLNVPQDSHFLAAINRLHSSSSYTRQHAITLEDFFTLYAELRVKSSSATLSPSPSITHWLWGMITTPFHWISDWMSSFYSSPSSQDRVCGGRCDVFLGGSCGSTRWRTDITIPILRQHGRTYFNPHIESWDTGLIPIERHAKENCAVLLFNISGDTLSVASMIEVSFYIGQRRAVVLCLNDISVDKVEGMKLSPAALKDYNRGRAYLASFSQHNGVPVFTDITQATLACVQMVNDNSQ